MGISQLKDIVDTDVAVEWYEWSVTTPRVTGYNQQCKIKFSNETRT